MTHGLAVRELTPGTTPLPLHRNLDVFRPPDRQRDALATIARAPRGRVLVADDGRETLGYLSFHAPDAVERWGHDRSGRLVELGAIEVAPGLRGERLGVRLLERGFAQGRYDDTVVFAALYAWHYDLERTGLGPLGYRRLLLRLYGTVGMAGVPTTDPEIAEDRANALVVRVGPSAPEAVVSEFERLRTLPT